MVIHGFEILSGTVFEYLSFKPSAHQSVYGTSLGSPRCPRMPHPQNVSDLMCHKLKNKNLEFKLKGFYFLKKNRDCSLGSDRIIFEPVRYQLETKCGWKWLNHWVCFNVLWFLSFFTKKNAYFSLVDLILGLCNCAMLEIGIGSPWGPAMSGYWSVRTADATNASCHPKSGFLHRFPNIINCDMGTLLFLQCNVQ